MTVNRSDFVGKPQRSTVDPDALGIYWDPTDPQGEPFVAPMNAHDASAISFSATGNIVATDVQAAIAELDSEKVSSTTTQSATSTKLQPFAIDFAATAAANFSIQSQSVENSGSQAGTFNNGVWFGFNAGRHGGSNVESNKPALIMGFEDNYYDESGDGFRGVEWYVEYYSPDGTTQEYLRPFYTRIQSDNNNAQGALVSVCIGNPASSDGVFQITTGIDAMGDTQVFAITATTCNVNVPFGRNNFGGNITVDQDLSNDRVRLGIVNALPTSSNGAYIGWANGISGLTAGDLALIPRSSASGSVRLYAGTTTPTLRASVVSSGFVVGTSAAGSFGGGINVVSLQNATTVPTTNPSGGGVLYAEGGALKWHGSSGTVTTIAAA